MTQIDVSALSLHSVPGPPEDTEAVLGVVMHTAVGSDPSEEWVSSIAMHVALLGRADEAAVDMLVMHTAPGLPIVLPDPPPTTGGPDPVILPPDDCTDEGGGPGTEGCCVPDLNGLIEMRMGPLNTIEDIRKALWYVQDRHNVLVREWNKLAAVTRTNFPRV